MLSAAHDLKYLRALKTYLNEQFQQPSDDFVRFVAKQVYEGVLTPRLKDQFSLLIRRSLQLFLNERISSRLKSALDVTNNSLIITPTIPHTSVPVEEKPVANDTKERDVVTTMEETEGFMIVRAILRKTVAVNRVVMRDVQSYCGILLDDNNRKPICRLHFNSSKKFVVLFDVEGGERVDIVSLDNLYGMASRIRAAVQKHEAK